MRRLTKPQRTTAALLLAVLAAAILGWLLPSGMPAGVLVLGAALGGLEALTAVGLVLIYRSARIINFSQVAIGGLASASAVLLVAGWGVPYGIAMLLGLLVAAGTGALIELAVVRRFWDRSRLVFTVATIGVALILGAVRIALPGLFADLGPTDGFKFPATLAIEVGPVIISADHLVAILVVPVVLTALWLFLERTRAGTALRAMADAPDRARLLGIPLRKLSLLTWVTAACLSGIATMLAVPMVGVNLGDVQGSQALLIPLAAAVVARMERIGVAALAAVGIGMLDQVVFWNYPRSSTVDVVLFGVILVALMAQRRSPADRSHKAPAFVVRPPPKLPVEIAALPQVRIGRVLAWLTLAAGVLLLPIWFDNSQLSFAANLAVYGMLAISLNVLTGWGGLVGLGQFAFAGIGGSATAFVLAELGLDVLIALPVGMIVGALVAGLVALPAIRFQPLFFAVTTFALAVPVASWLLNPTNFALLTPSSLERPVIAGRWDLQSPLSYYYFCLAGVVLVIAAQLNLRRSRVGRSIIATRDNPQVAASMSISPNGSLMTAVFISGAMAALAGGIWVIGLRSVPFNAFSPEASIQLFTMVVIGGLGSTLGVLLGAAYVWAVDFYLRGAAQLLATGAGMLVLLMVMPEGLAGAIYRARDRLATAVLRQREPTAAPGPPGPPARPAETSRTESTSDGAGSAGHRDPTATPLLSVDGLDAGYSHMPVLDSVGFSLAEGTITALVGPNGSGKTTTLRTISGLLPAQSGSIRLDGEHLEEATASDRVEHGLATVFGGEDVFGSLSVADNLLLGNWLGRSPDPDAVLELFPELERRRDSPADTLSGGERQMLTIAQALLTQPRVLLIDEMSLGLSPARVAGIKEVVRRLARDRNVTVLVVEQSAEVVADLADSIIEIDRGRVGVAGGGTPQGAIPPPGAGYGRPTAPRAEAGDSAGPVLALEGVSVRHGGVEALADVDLELRSNEILGLIGANGAGKTTLLDACSGFARTASGSIRLLGEDVTRSSPSARSTRGLGRVFQQAVMYPTLTVAEVLSVARERFITARDPLASALRLPHVAASEERVRAEVDEILDASGLFAERETLFEDLPLGVRRRVQLWAALAHEPEVLLLDEPTAGLASDEASEIGEFVLELPGTHQVSILITEHDVPLVLAVSGRLVAMDRGRVIADGPPDRVMDDPAVRSSYLGITTRPEDS